jgi:hypothetical protein
MLKKSVFLVGDFEKGQVYAPIGCGCPDSFAENSPFIRRIFAANKTYICHKL